MQYKLGQFLGRYLGHFGGKFSGQTKFIEWPLRFIADPRGRDIGDVAPADVLKTVFKVVLHPILMPDLISGASGSGQNFNYKAMI